MTRGCKREQSVRGGRAERSPLEQSRESAGADRQSKRVSRTPEPARLAPAPEALRGSTPASVTVSGQSPPDTCGMEVTWPATCWWAAAGSCTHGKPRLSASAVARPPAAAGAPNNQTCDPRYQADAMHQSKSRAEPGLPPPQSSMMPWLQRSDRRRALAYTEQHSSAVMQRQRI